MSPEKGVTWPPPLTGARHTLATFTHGAKGYFLFSIFYFRRCAVCGRSCQNSKAARPIYLLLV